MSDLCLLVPMNIEALVVGDSATSTEWVNLQPDFRGIYRRDQVVGQQLEKPLLFSPSTGLHKAGIHLHWALPDGLTHGVAANNGGKPEFPLIPNRWLVFRLWDQGEPTQRLDFRTKVWIIESDTITSDSSAAVWPSLSSENLKKADDYSVFVGKQFELSQWPGETSAPHLNITAIGYGDSAFAAYYPACKGILGFHDSDLTGVSDGARLTYTVVGWYSDPSKDPLQQAMAKKSAEDPIALLDEFLGKTRWIYPGFGAATGKISKARELVSELKEAKELMARFQDARQKIDRSDAIAELQKRITEIQKEREASDAEVTGLQNNLPTHILCHGIIAGVQWKNTVDSGVPRGRPLRLSAGDTTVDALAALFEKECGSDLAKMLAVFQYDLLTEIEKPGGDSIIDSKIHERSYRPLARGIRWDLLQDARPSFGSSPEDRSPPIPGDIRMLLEKLNTLQRRINRLKRERDSLRGEIYATWYKKVLNTEAKRVGDDILTQRLADLQQEVAGLTGEVAQLEQEKAGHPIIPEWEEIQEKLEAFLPGWKLQQLDEPEFWRPNDPVVLLAGDACQRSARHGEDGRFRSDGRLLCRLSGQEIIGIKITIPYAVKKDVEFGPADVDRWIAPFNATGNRPVPPEVTSLFRESLLLTVETKRARDIVTAAYEKNETGSAQNHDADIEILSGQLLDLYLKKVWQDARDPRVENPKLRYPDTEIDGQPSWELIGEFPSPVVINQWERNPWLPLFLQWQVGWVPFYSDTWRALEGWKLEDFHFVRTVKDPQKAQDNAVYSGTSLLTPSAGLNLSERLRQYNLAHDNMQLQTLQTAINAMNVLCQSLGGFTDQLLMRQSHLEMRPLDPGKGDDGPQFSPIFDLVKDIDWLSPMTDGKFFPVRAGQLELEKLWVIDAFGQFLKLEDEDRVNGLRPVLPQRLAGSDGSLRFEPRLAQPARLSLQWLPAGRWGATAAEERPLGDDEEFNPICGWVLPNFFDKALMVYDARGYALGTLQGVQRKSWREGVGALREPVESFHWVDIPGGETFFFGKPEKRTTDPLGTNANPHVRAFIKGLLSLAEGSGQAFADLLDKMNEALSAAGGTSSSRHPDLALLIGRPLALVRASIRLEVDGRIACAQGWDDVQSEQTGRIEQLKFPLRLGDRRKWNDTWLGDDGLMGFFLDQNYSRFYPASGLEGQSDSYNIYGWVPQISIAEPLDLTLLMDPSAGVCATSGLLPRTIFHLPYGDVTETLENKQVVFFTGPLIAPESDSEIRMPQPSDLYGHWSWTHHPDVKVWREESIADVQKEQGRFPDAALHIAEGWLKLTTAPLTIRGFALKGKNPAQEERIPQSAAETLLPARFEAFPGEPITLSWSVIGAEEIELREGESVLFKTQRHPLPTQYSIQVLRDTVFTLVASGREQTSTADKEPRRVTASKSIAIKLKEI
jgi:hypothetical protein